MREYIPHGNNIRKLFFIVKVQKWSEVFIWWLCYLDIPCTNMNSTKDKNYDQHIYQKLQMSCQHELLIGFASSIKCSFQVFLNAAKVCLLTENRVRNLILTEWQKMCIQILKYLSICSLLICIIFLWSDCTVRSGQVHQKTRPWKMK